MKTPTTYHSNRPEGFTLMETVIAIGVLAVLLTGFIAAFTPAAQGIRRSISIEQADRLSTTLEKELVTLREGQGSSLIETGFDKSFEWIKGSNNLNTALFIYQYRGDPSITRTDGTPTPIPSASGEPGADYVTQSAVRRRTGDSNLTADLAALEGQVFYVKIAQLIQGSNGLVKGAPGLMKAAPMSSGGGNATTADEYEEGAIAFVADFYNVPTKADAYLTGSGSNFKNLFIVADNPVFSRNMAVRR